MEQIIGLSEECEERKGRKAWHLYVGPGGGREGVTEGGQCKERNRCVDGEEREEGWAVERR